MVRACRQQNLSMPSYNVLSFASLSYMSYNTIDCIFLIYISVAALSVYLFVSTFIDWLFRQWRAAGKWESWCIQCVYNAIDDRDVIDAMFVNCDDFWL